jgi:hypothetical protein
MQTRPPSRILAAIAVGGALVAVLDALDAVVAFKLAYGLSPVAIYQFVASGALGPSAFAGGVPAALLGLGFHFVIAYSAATVFIVAASRLPTLLRSPVPWGLLFGVGVWLVMGKIVLPLSRVQPSPFHLGLMLNGIVGHALLVGLVPALVARRFLGAPSSEARAAPARATVAA